MGSFLVLLFISMIITACFTVKLWDATYSPLLTIFGAIVCFIDFVAVEFLIIFVCYKIGIFEILQSLM